MTTWGPDGRATGDPEEAPRGPAEDPVGQVPVGEQATTALPRPGGQFPYPYPPAEPATPGPPPSAAPAPSPPPDWPPPTEGGVAEQRTIALDRPAHWGGLPGPATPAPGTGAERLPPPTGPGWGPPAPDLPPPGMPPPGMPPPGPPASYPAPASYLSPPAHPAAPPPRYESPPRGSHLPPYVEPPPPAASGPGLPTPADAGPPAGDGTGETPTTPGRTGPRKLTVTRVAAFRSRELTTRGVQMFRRAAGADGADRSGLTALTYAVMANYAVDAALAVALANTLFFAAATAESTGKVLLYLLITVAPFAVIAPFIGPGLDRLQHGRRVALAASSFARAVLALVMAFNFDSWVLYPAALGMLVLSKSFGVLKAAVTPRVLPPDITLVKTNSRLAVFGLIAGGVAGAVAAGLAWASGSTGALVFTALCAIVGGVLCLRIPAWVESTEGEVPVDGIAHGRAGRKFPLTVVTTLWANGTIRVETGFLALFIAFVIKVEYPDASGFAQLLMLGVVGVAAGVGGFLGNGLGARLPLTAPETTAIVALASVIISTVIAILAPGLLTAAIVGLVGSTASSLAKVCLDSVIQHELPEASRASAFGRSETVLQLSWVFGGVIGLLIGGVWSFGSDRVYVVGFAIVTVLLLLGLTQSLLVRRGRSMFPWLDYSRLTRRRRRGAAAGEPRPTAVDGGARAAGQPAAPTGWTAAPPPTSRYASPGHPAAYPTPPLSSPPAGGAGSAPGPTPPRREVREAGKRRRLGRDR